MRRAEHARCAGLVAIVLLAACSSSEENRAPSTQVDTTIPTPGAPGALPDGAPAPSDGGTLPDGAPVGDAEPPPRPYVELDINHVLSTGQSNAVANDGKPIVSTTQPYGNLMFDTGVITGGGCDGDGCRSYQTPTAFAPLVEGDTFFYAIETMSSGLGNQITKLGLERFLVGKKRHDVLVSLHGRSGNSYSCLRKGSCDWWPGRGYVQPFEEAMMQVTSAKQLAAAQGKTYGVRAVTAIHGEHDHYAAAAGGSLFPLARTDGKGMLADYGEALEEWQRDYDAAIKAITAQTIDVPLFVSQYSHWNNVPTTVIAYQQLAAHVRSKGKVNVIGPTYQLPYTSTCLHFTGPGERWLGEYFAKAYAKVVMEGVAWEPLRPIGVSMAGNVVTVKLKVPKPPIVIDTTKVSNPGNYGFEVHDDSGATPSITNVAIVGTDSVAITLSGPLTGANKRVRYAYTFTGCGGNGTVARGNIRDSDDTMSQSGNDLSNWLVHFDEPVP